MFQLSGVHFRVIWGLGFRVVSWGVYSEHIETSETLYLSLKPVYEVTGHQTFQPEHILKSNWCEIGLNGLGFKKRG